MAVRKKLTKISRDVLEATARILGPSSAAAQALASADSHDGKTYFFKCGNTIIVQKIPSELCSTEPS